MQNYQKKIALYHFGKKTLLCNRYIYFVISFLEMQL